jgi:hypothetical protein
MAADKQFDSLIEKNQRCNENPGEFAFKHLCFRLLPDYF